MKPTTLGQLMKLLLNSRNGSVHYVDFQKGYWMVVIHPDSRDVLSMDDSSR